MKKLSLEVDLNGIDRSKENGELTPQKLVQNVLVGLIFSYAQANRGLNFKEQRHFYKIDGLFNQVVKENKKELELEDDDFGFLHKCCKEGKTMPNLLVNRVLDLVEKVEYR